MTYRLNRLGLRDMDCTQSAYVTREKFAGLTLGFKLGITESAFGVSVPNERHFSFADAGHLAQRGRKINSNGHTPMQIMERYVCSIMNSSKNFDSSAWALTGMIEAIC